MATGVQRKVLLLRLSRLPAGQAKPLHLRLARGAVEPMTHLSRARLYVLVNNDVLVVWRGAAEPALSEALRGLRHLIVEGCRGVRHIADLAEVAMLPRDGVGLLRLLEGSVAAPIPPRPDDEQPTRRLDPAALARLERSLARADVASFVRCQRVCDTTGGAMTLAWEKRSIQVDELVAALEPGCACTNETWLFRRLTRACDQRMLALLSSSEELRGASPFALTVNVASIVSPAFLRFDEVLPANLRGSVILELTAADVLADPALFAFARNYARHRGFKLLLRGVAPSTLAMLSLQALGMDYLRIDWTASLPNDCTRRALAMVADLDSVVLAGSDSLEALEWGWRLGLRLFQGRMLTANAPGT
jgi:hypothetical protein